MLPKHLKWRPFYVNAVTIPNTIVKIGRYAFRNPKYINFHAPSYVDIESIKEGKSFEY